jgi:anti-sigma factor RsiW
MMAMHADFLELAAQEIDFELTPAERETLARHLASCVSCRRAAVGLRADQVAVSRLELIPLDPARAARVWRGLERHDRPSPARILRLVAIAALLALLAQGALVVGSQLLRDRNSLPELPPKAVVIDTSTEPSAQAVDAAIGQFAPGSIVEVVVPDLRVRTAPTVDNSLSAKLDPLLGIGVRLQVIEGPVDADGYHWYRVQALDLPHAGWVAAADHDGEPWIDIPRATASASPTFAPAEAALVAALRGDAAVACAPRRRDLPIRAVAGVECRIASGIVARVGAYGFGGVSEATTAYLERLASYGVASSSGDCAGGHAGDAPWSPDGRTGCFLDENGSANVRVTCGSTYVGVLGHDDAIADLYRWTWKPADPSAGGGTAPGICSSAQ